MYGKKVIFEDTIQGIIYFMTLHQVVVMLLISHTSIRKSVMSLPLVAGNYDQFLCEYKSVQRLGYDFEHTQGNRQLQQHLLSLTKYTGGIKSIDRGSTSNIALNGVTTGNALQLSLIVQVQIFLNCEGTDG
jgi:hypothetical protein